MNIILQIIMLIFVIAGTITDFKYKKVFNKITFPLMLIGMIGNTIIFGFSGLTNSILGLIIAFVVTQIATLFINNIGFGDLKLLMGIGACMGYEYFFSCYLIALVLLIFFNILINPNIVLNAAKNVKSLMTIMLMTGERSKVCYEYKNKGVIFAPYILTGCILTSILYQAYGINLTTILF